MTKSRKSRQHNKKDSRKKRNHQWKARSCKATADKAPKSVIAPYIPTTSKSAASQEAKFVNKQVDELKKTNPDLKDGGKIDDTIKQIGLEKRFDMDDKKGTFFFYRPSNFPDSNIQEHLDAMVSKQLEQLGIANKVKIVNLGSSFIYISYSFCTRISKS